MQRAEGTRVIDPLAVFLIHDAHDDGIVQSELRFYQIVKRSVHLIRGQHILRIGVDVDPGNLQAQHESKQQHAQVHAPGTLSSQPNDTMLHEATCSVRVAPRMTPMDMKDLPLRSLCGSAHPCAPVSFLRSQYIRLFSFRQY